VEGVLPPPAGADSDLKLRQHASKSSVPREGLAQFRTLVVTGFRCSPGGTSGLEQSLFNAKCILCHNAEKFKGKLRLDDYEHVMLGGKDGPVISPGNPAKSEMYRRITLPPDSKDFMPAEGKPPLSAAETKVLEVWIAARATTHIAEEATRDLPPSTEEKNAAPPLTADYRPQLKTIAEMETSLGIRIVLRSQNPTDGLILRTVSAPERCTDETPARLAPVGNLIVDAELARTKVTDRGMQSLANFSNLRFLDLSDTAVTSASDCICSKRTETCALKTQVCLPAPRARRFLGGLTFDPCKDEPTSGVSRLPVSTKM
jgi:hypothetical protein